MTLRKTHFWFGLIGVAVFLATGIYMRVGFPDLYAANEIVRYHYRANHIYILLAGLLNLSLGCYLRLGAGWRKQLAVLGSALLLLAPVVLVAAFILEAPKGAPDRPLTLIGIFMAFIGVLCHALGRSVGEHAA